MFFVQASTSIDVQSGHAYYARLESMSESSKWAGIEIVNNGADLNEGVTPFTSFALISPIVTQNSFPGDNLKDNLHYYAAMYSNSFNVNNVINASLSDLDSEELFNSTNFPVFYPGYNNLADSPKNTFLSTGQVILGGTNYTAVKALIATGISYYVLQYNSSSGIIPLFLVSFTDSTCYNGTSCVGEFLLPLTSGTSNVYNFYMLSQATQYNYSIWIDGEETLNFSQTALPYNLTVQVRDLYSGTPVSGADVLVGEDRGNNLFIPYRLDGVVSTNYAVGNTAANGYETFIVAPTIYPSNDTYSIYVAVELNGNIVSKQTLNIDESTQINTESKSFTPSTLSNNLKASVNSQNTIIKTLYYWANTKNQALRYDIEYELSNNSFSIDYVVVGFGNFPRNNLSLKTAAPHLINVTVTNFGVPQSGYTIGVNEIGGLLVLNPTDYESPLTNKSHNDMLESDAGQMFIIVPTSYGTTINSNITLKVYNSFGTVVGELTEIEIDKDISTTYTTGTAYQDNLLKEIINSLNAVIKSLYTSLNF